MPPRVRVAVSAPEMSSDARSTAESESSSESACAGSLPLSSSLPSLSGGPNACAASAAAAITSLAPAASAAAPLWKPDACSTARAAAFASANVLARDALTTPELTPEPAPELAPERRGSARTDGSFGTTRRGISHSRPVSRSRATAARPRGAWGEIQTPRREQNGRQERAGRPQRITQPRSKVHGVRPSQHSLNMFLGQGRTLRGLCTYGHTHLRGDAGVEASSSLKMSWSTHMQSLSLFEPTMESRFLRTAPSASFCCRARLRYE